MDPSTATFFMGSLAALVLGGAALSAYAYLWFRFGNWMGLRARSRGSLGWSTARFALAWIPVGIPALFLPADVYVRSAGALCLFVLHAQPACLGYYSGRLTAKQERDRRWNKNADDWLAEWECRPVSSSQDEGPSP
jgi:hypothetical protein